MRIGNDAWIVKWAYLFSSRTPVRTSLCAFFWRCVLVTPLICAVIAAVISGLAWGLYVALIVKGFWWVATIAAVLFAAWYVADRSGALRSAGFKVADAIDAIADTRPIRQGQWAVVVLWRGLKAVKAKMCPVIELCDIEPDSMDEAPDWGV
jgi:hypothetical protein